MPLSEPEAGVLIPADLRAAGPWAGEPALVVRCSWCGYLVRTHEADRCGCGRVETRPAVDGREVAVTGPGVADAEVYRMAVVPPAG